MKQTLLTALLAATYTLACAQDIAADSLASGALRNPEDEGLPWTYIVLVAVLVAAFLFLRRSSTTLPSKRGRG